MARFFAPDSYEATDYMYKLPVDAMMKAVATTDAANDAIINQTDLFSNSLTKIAHLTGDNDRVKAIQDSYNSKINDLTQSLMTDPTQYRKQMPQVRQLGRELFQDMNAGELAAIQGNANKLAEWDKTYAPMVAKGEIRPEAYQAMRGAFINQFKGTTYDSNTGVYNQLKTEDIYKTQDFNKLLKDNVGTIKANAKEYKNTSDGGKWLVTSGGKEEWVDAKRVAQIAMDTLMGDQNVVGYLKQGGKYGYLQGVYDKQGQFINPYQLDKKGQPVFNNASILTAPIRGLVGQEAYKQTSSTSDIAVNPYTKALTDFDLDMKKMAVQSKMDREDFVFEENIKHNNAEDMAELQAVLKEGNAEKIAAYKAGLTGKALQKDVVGTPTSPVKKQVDGSFNWWWTPAGSDGKITNDNLIKDIAEARQVAVNNRAMAQDMSNGLTDNERSVYMAKALAAERGIAAKSELANIARTDVNEALTKQGFNQRDLASLNNIRSRTDQLEKAYKDAQLQYVTAQSNPYYEQQPEKLKQVKGVFDNIKAQYNHAKTLRDTDDKLMNSWFENNKDKTKFNVAGVPVTTAQEKTISDFFTKNVSLFQPKDLSGKTDSRRILANKDLSVTDIGQLKPVAINAPTAGMPASVAFKDPKGNVFLQEISGDLQKKFGIELSHSIDPKRRKIGEAISDFSKATAVAELNDRLINFEGGRQAAGHTNLPSISLEVADDLNPGKKKKIEFTPELILQPSADKVNSVNGTLGVYRAKITLPTAKGQPQRTLDLGEVASPEAAVDKGYEVYKQMQ